MRLDSSVQVRDREAESADTPVAALPRAYGPDPADYDPKARLLIHRALHAHYQLLLGPPEQFRAIPDLNDDAGIRRIEDAWRASEESRAKGVDVPSRPGDFGDWYYAWIQRHNARTEPLFQFLTHEATLNEMAMFFVAEEMVDSKFDDMMALAQLGCAGGIKMTIAKNFWDEMGDGTPALVHTKMFDDSVRFMKAHLDAGGVDYRRLQFWEIYANANQLLMYGVHRRFALRLIGTLGILEGGASGRFAAMVRGCERLEVPAAVIAYQAAHVGIDERHGDEWFEGVLQPLVELGSPALLEEIALGVLTRYHVATDYYQAVLADLATGRYR